MAAPLRPEDCHPWEDGVNGEETEGAEGERCIDKRKTIESPEVLNTPVRILDPAFKQIEVARDMKDYLWGPEQIFMCFRLLPAARAEYRNPVFIQKMTRMLRAKNLAPTNIKGDEYSVEFTMANNRTYSYPSTRRSLEIMVNPDFIMMIHYRPETMREILLEIDLIIRGDIRSERDKVQVVKDVLASRGAPDEMDTGPLGDILDMAGIPKPPKPRGARRRKTHRKKGGRRRRTVKK